MGYGNLDGVTEETKLYLKFLNVIRSELFDVTYTTHVT